MQQLLQPPPPPLHEECNRSRGLTLRLRGVAITHLRLQHALDPLQTASPVRQETPRQNQNHCQRNSPPFASNPNPFKCPATPPHSPTAAPQPAGVRSCALPSPPPPPPSRLQRTPSCSTWDSAAQEQWPLSQTARRFQPIGPRMQTRTCSTTSTRAPPRPMQLSSSRCSPPPPPTSPSHAVAGAGCRRCSLHRCILAA